jgi:Protein of unknown function (DUF3145).
MVQRPSRVPSFRMWSGRFAMSLPGRPQIWISGLSLSHRGSVRAVANWRGPAGSAARIASALRVMPDTLFEVVEEFASDREGERYAYTPSLGLFRATIGVHGDIYLHEDRVRAAIDGAREHGVDLAEGLAHLLGDAWDVELEPYRVATSDTPIRVLHHVV